MSRFRLIAPAVLSVVLYALVVRGAEEASPHRYSHPGRTVAIADVHGAFDEMTAILRQTGLIGEDERWTGGASHLVIVGDLLDRGPHSRRAMDLLIALEPQAIAAGGRVHVVLGNHEVMNLVGDLRYVSAEEYAAFAPDETAEMRDRGWAGHVRFHGAPDDMPAARAAFEAQYPAGYFALKAAFGAEGRYGKWLLEKPVIVAVNDTAFVHGGLSEAAAQSSFRSLNEEAAQQIRTYLREYRTLVEAGVLPLTSDFYGRSKMLDDYAAGVAAGTRSWSEETAAAATRLKELEFAFVHSPQSPLWYRGNVACGAPIEAGRLKAALRAAGVSRLVVGHTPTPSRRALARFEGILLEIDTGMLSAYYKGRATALIVDPSGISVAYQSEPELAQAMPQPRRVGLRRPGLSADELANLLESGELVSRTEDDAGNLRLGVADGAAVIEAAVMPRSGQPDFFPEVAAYRLDRLLGLDMVPVTVLREIDGQTRELQYLPPRTIDEQQRAERRLGGDAFCPLTDQFNALYLFDTLIFAAPRQTAQIRYSTDNWQLILVGHQGAFGSKRGRPKHLAEIPLELTTGRRERLEALDEASLKQALDGVLSKRRIKALLKRRDKLLEG